MVTITHRHEWDMGHRLPWHEGKCARLHGHRYVAEIDVTGEIQTDGSAAGMVVDFYVIKERVKALIDAQWDHRTMLWKRDPLAVKLFHVNDGDVIEDVDIGVFYVDFMPTAENISFEILSRLRKSGLNVTRVRVWETPNGSAEVRA
jgi:6-pyruvoyltetrahydropterin/6-carboxytetrahydropterin synthase